jgi:cytosine/creatinine deaminase
MEANPVGTSGIKVGAKSDFVTLKVEHAQAAVASPPQGRRVYKSGKLVARNGHVLRQGMA